MSLAEVTTSLTGPGALFEMDLVTLDGVPTRTWKHAPPTLRTVLERSASYGAREYLVYDDERLTFAEHFALAADVATTLIGRFGITKGDRVAIAMGNLPEWVLTFWATLAAGAVVVPLNPWWTGSELASALRDSGAIVVVVDRERHERIAPELDGVPALAAMVTCDETPAPDRLLRAAMGTTIDRPNGPPVAVVPFVELIVPGSGGVLPEASILPDDDATILYTSGTTGPPKGVVGSHRNAVSALMNLSFVFTAGRMAGTAQLGSVDGAPDATLLTMALFHATGCQAILVANTAAGYKLVMMRHFDPDQALELIERERITLFGGVPSTVTALLDDPSFAAHDTSSVHLLAFGGAPAPPTLVRRIKQRFPTGTPGNGYGMTETSSVATMNLGTDYLRKPDSVGRPVPTCDVAIVPVGYAGVVPVPGPFDPRRTGELWVRGPNVVRGYWNRPEDTAATFTDGWVHTGDVGRIDEEGFVHIVDRIEDMIVRGGENVYCGEVENALTAHPAVAECAVIGVPDPVLGEEVGAVVVLRRGKDVDADELSRLVTERLASFAVPSRFWFVPGPLPCNPAGKVLKAELRAKPMARSGPTGAAPLAASVNRGRPISGG